MIVCNNSKEKTISPKLMEKLNFHCKVISDELSDILCYVFYLDTRNKQYIDKGGLNCHSSKIQILTKIIQASQGEVEVFLKKLSHHIHPEDIKTLQTYSTRTLNYKKTPSYVFRIIDPQTNKVYYIKRGVNFIDTIAIVRLTDITKEKEKEKEKKEKEYLKQLKSYKDQLESIHKSISGFVYTFKIDMQGIPSFSYISEGCYPIYNISAEKIIKDPSLTIDVIHPDDKQQFEEFVQESAQTLQPFSWEGRLIINDTIKTI